MKTILVTGAATGIGLAVSAALSNDGHYSVLATALPEQDCSGLEKLARVSILRVDLSDKSSIAELVSTVNAQGAVDGIINCAGIAVPGPLEMIPISQLALQFQINTFAPIQIIQGLLPQLRASKGRVVIIGAGQARAPLPCGGAYGSSKAALSALMDSLRAEIQGFGVGVSVIEPGAIKTGILKSTQDKWGSVALSASHGMEADVLSFYKNAMDKSFSASAKAFETAIAPEQFAHTVVSVLKSKKPKPRYLVGREAKAMGFVAVLPDKIRAALMRNMMQP